jgi:hypothetical protein
MTERVFDEANPRHVTPDMVAFFYGDDNLDIQSLLCEMADIINNVYTASDARKDIIDHWRGLRD